MKKMTPRTKEKEQDTFLQEMYQELERRITMMEEGHDEYKIERINFNHLILPNLVTLASVLLLFIPLFG